MRIVVTGKEGQVSRALQALAGDDLTITALGRPELDLAKPETVFPAIETARPDVIVSAAAYTAVDKAESDPEAAFAVNRDGAVAIVKAAIKLNVPVIHLSTDYVFGGTKPEPYVETDPVGPTSVYGQSKLEGEQAVAMATPNHVILRTAWVYSVYGHNFLKTMLRLAETRDELHVVSDQYGCPTSADDIAGAVVEIAHRLVADTSSQLRGVFHMTGDGETNWSGFARLILEAAAQTTGRTIKVHDIPTNEYPTPAKRPANSRLNCNRLVEIYGIRLPDWRQSATATVDALVNNTGETP